MPWPTTIVEIAFDDGPYVASPTWTDVTSYVRHLSINRGRNGDFDDFNAGTCQITLDNRTQRFSPFNTSSPYNGKLIPRRQVRVRATSGASTYDVFRGYINNWPVSFTDSKLDSTVTIACYDILGLCSTETIPAEFLTSYTLGLNPIHYWKFNDTAAATTFYDQISQANMAFDTSSGLSLQPNVETSSPLGTGMISRGINVGGNRYKSTATFNGATPISISWWTQLLPNGIGTGMYWYYGDRAINIAMSTASSAATVRCVTTAAGTFYNTPTLNVSAPLHFVVSWDGSTTPTIYVNGTAITVASSGADAMRAVSTYDQAYAYYGVHQEFSVYNYQLNATQAGLLYQYGIGRIPETTAARFTRVMGFTNLPAALYQTAINPKGNISQIGTTSKIVDELKITADTEGGFIFATKAGVLKFTDRNYPWTNSTSANSQATFADTGAVGTLKYGTEIDYQWDAEQLRNQVSITFTGDGTTTSTNAAIAAAYGGQSATINSYAQLPSDAVSLATFELGTGGTLVPRVSPIEIGNNTADTAWQTILGLELLDRITLTTTPSTGSAISNVMLINGIEHDITPERWYTKLRPSKRYAAGLVLNDSHYGKLDFNYLT